MIFRFHVLGMTHLPTDKTYSACAFNMKAYKFCQMMKKKGHYILLYGVAGSTAPCDEFIECITNSEFQLFYKNHDWFQQGFNRNIEEKMSPLFNKRCGKALLNRVQKFDFVLPFWGIGHKKAFDQLDTSLALIVEPGIGNHFAFSDYRVYESYAVMNYVSGMQDPKPPSYYHVVIPNYFDTKDFSFRKKRDDFFLFLGRLEEIKGLYVAIDVCHKLNKRLVIAGQGSISSNIDPQKLKNVEIMGYADIEMRRNLMSRAKGFFLLTQYNEPFGGAAVEAMMSGCPVIVTDWGVFSETVIHGVTGYRTRTFEQIVWAVQNIDQISPSACRDWAISNYSLERVSCMYEEYFLSLSDLWNDGWYTERDTRENLNWLKIKYPFQ